MIQEGKSVKNEWQEKDEEIRQLSFRSLQEACIDAQNELRLNQGKDHSLLSKIEGCPLHYESNYYKPISHNSFCELNSLQTMHDQNCLVSFTNGYMSNEYVLG